MISISRHDARNCGLCVTLRLCVKLRSRQAQGLTDWLIELNPNNSYAFLNLARIYIKENEVEKACAAMETGMKLGFTKDYGPELESMRTQYCK